MVELIAKYIVTKHRMEEAKFEADYLRNDRLTYDHGKPPTMDEILADRDALTYQRTLEDVVKELEIEINAKPFWIGPL